MNGKENRPAASATSTGCGYNNICGGVTRTRVRAETKKGQRTARNRLPADLLSV